MDRVTSLPQRHFLTTHTLLLLRNAGDMKSQDRKLEFELDILTAQLPNAVTVDACSLTI